MEEKKREEKRENINIGSSEAKGRKWRGKKE